MCLEYPVVGISGVSGVRLSQRSHLSGVSGVSNVQAIIEDETTTHEQWLDVVHVCQVYGYHDGLTSQVCQMCQMC